MAPFDGSQPVNVSVGFRTQVPLPDLSKETLATAQRAGREYVEIAHNEVDEVIMATPAISDGLIVIRTMGHVYGFGEEPDDGPENR